MHKYSLLLAILVWFCIWGALKWVNPPIPGSVMTLFMSIATVSILVFIMADENRYNSFLAPILKLLTEDQLFVPRVFLLTLFPLFMGWVTYERIRPRFDPPYEGRTIHPEAPSTFRFQGKSFDVLNTTNPLRDPAELTNFKDNLREGKSIYFLNCAFCHGDLLDGNGHFSAAFNPLPANFRDIGTISQLEETYVFWRTATGGPGLPMGATPWNSSMPVWQDFLSEKEIWQVVLYIYDASGSTPRTWE
ncbi:MAG: cytochrome c [Gammaproteobacteria bacterium]|nr:cytochrome c [Gammaproteobacteria bacterium]